jgi:Ca-activated chloride channel family protein
VFGSAAYLQTPFTDDHQVWSQLLAETEIGMAGQSTVFGDAIGLAIKLFQESDSDSNNRVLIMLTDGNDTGSTVPPVDAAKVAAANGIRIYTIAIGDPASVGEEALDMDAIARVSESISFRPRQSLHWLPIGIALLLYTVYHGLGTWRAWRQWEADSAA